MPLDTRPGFRVWRHEERFMDRDATVYPFEVIAEHVAKMKKLIVAYKLGARGVA
jgi:hypothetical protein